MQLGVPPTALAIVHHHHMGLLNFTNPQLVQVCCFSCKECSKAIVVFNETKVFMGVKNKETFFLLNTTWHICKTHTIQC